MSERIRIDKVTQEADTWSNRFGSYQGYDLDLVKENGEVEIGVGNNRKLKPDGSHFEPKAGEEVWGEIEPDGRGGQKLAIDANRMKDEPLDGHQTSSPGSSQPRSTSKGPGGGETDWTVKGAEIRRQHSQEMALRLMSHPQFSLAPETCTVHIAEWADFFDQDAIAAGQKHSAPSSNHPEQPIDFSGAVRQDTPPSEFPDDSQQHLAHLMENAGLDPVGANAIAIWIFEEEHKAPEKKETRVRMEKRLEDASTQAFQLQGLKTLYETRTGNLVPVATDDPSLPF